MKIIGVDFTSRPTKAKPITCAKAELENGILSIRSLSEIECFRDFEDLLSSASPWVAGMDFPFGQSRRFIINMGWPESWEKYVRLVGALGRAEFVQLLEGYKANRPAGDKEHRRAIDRRANSISPQKLYGVPVGKMFYEGAPRLLNSPASIIPVRMNDDQRMIVEAYPAVIARRYIDRCSYKNDAPSKQTRALREARQDIVSGILSPGFRETYGFGLCVPAELGDICIEDATGDRLDALLCCIQAAWAWLNREQGYGVPKEVDITEGWISDPLFRDHMAG